VTDKIVVLNTCGTEDEALKVARLLVERKLAACVNVLPGLRSIYRWKGAVEDSSEHLLVIKTSRALLGAVRSALEEVHSYDLPEVIALPIVDGSQRYLEWLEGGLASDEDAAR
jgi:periplasmic divalent cation tolerance protein